MIRITCTSCKTVLSIDDAFAGGVCRCQHCGTIQTVPAHLKGSAERAEAEAAEGASSKTLYENRSRTAVAAPSGSGLDDLAGAVASSGLSDTRLNYRTVSASPANKQNQLFYLLVLAGAVIVVLILVIVGIFLFSSHAPGAATNAQTPAAPAPPSAFSPSGEGKLVDSDATPTPNNPAQAPVPTAAPAPASPNCCGVKLTSDSIVYLIDNGSSASRLLDDIKFTVCNSVESLGPKRRFQILFWNPDSAGYGPAAATPENLDAARKAIDDVIAQGSTDPIQSLKKALASNPGEIVFITAKGLELEDPIADAVLAARGSSPVKIHVIDINGSDADTALAKIAAKTGGSFTPFSERQLKAAGY